MPFDSPEPELTRGQRHTLYGMLVGKVVKGQRDVVTAAEWAGGAALLAEVLGRSQARLMEQMGAGKQDDWSARAGAAQRGQTDRTVVSFPLDRLGQKHKDKHINAKDYFLT